MLQSTVLALGVFSNGNQIHLLVAGVHAGDRDARPHVGVKIKCFP